MIMVTLRDENGTFAYDLELPYDMEAERLTEQIVRALGAYNRKLRFTGSEGLYAPRLRRRLRPCETMEQVGLQNGEYLVLTR